MDEEAHAETLDFTTTRTGGRKLSERPEAVRVRIRKSARNLNRDVPLLYKPLDEWDMEELARGRPRNAAGTFSGPAPAWVTPLLIKEAQTRLKSVTKSQMGSYASDALTVMHRLMMDESTDFETGKPLTPPTVRLQAATYLLDQTVGKPTTHAEVEVNVKLDTLLSNIMVNDDRNEVAHPVIMGEVADDDDDEDGDGE